MTIQFTERLHPRRRAGGPGGGQFIRKLAGHIAKTLTVPGASYTVAPGLVVRKEKDGFSVSHLLVGRGRDGKLTEDRTSHSASSAARAAAIAAQRIRVADGGKASPATRKSPARLVRTNAKPEGGGFLGKPVDMPDFDVMVGGEKVGEVRGRLARDSQHYSSGSSRIWYSKYGGKSSSHSTKTGARDHVLDQHTKAQSAEVERGPGGMLFSPPVTERRSIAYPEDGQQSPQSAWRLSRRREQLLDRRDEPGVKAKLAAITKRLAASPQTGAITRQHLVGKASPPSGGFGHLSDEELASEWKRAEASTGRWAPPDARPYGERVAHLRALNRELGKRGGKQSPPSGGDAYARMKATAAALGLPWDDEAMKRQMGVAPALKQKVPKPKQTSSGWDISPTTGMLVEPHDAASGYVPTAYQTGRGPHGKLRNFKAMSDSKFGQVFAQVMKENNDHEAISALTAEKNERKAKQTVPGEVPGLPGIHAGIHTPAGIGAVHTHTAADVGSLAGKRVVVTGKLTTGTRTAIHGKIALAGGKPMPQITNHTDLLVVGDKPGSKLAKAKAAGIPVITEHELKKLFESIAPHRLRMAARVGELLEASEVWELAESAMSMEQRKRLPKSAFAIPEKAPGAGSYPIHDIAHARNALARSSGKPVAARVRAAVSKRYPKLAAKA